MMKRYINKLCAMFLAFILCLNVSIPAAYAYSNKNTNTLPPKDVIVAELVKLGFTDQEIEELFIKFPYEENISFLSDPSHPDVTNTYYISTTAVKSLGYAITIGLPGLGLSSADWVKIITKTVGWEVTLLVGAIALAAADMFMGPNGVKLDITFRWTYGDNSMTWQYLPIDFELTKY